MFKEMGILPNLPIELGNETILINVEVINSTLDYDMMERIN
jgi:hypothetical protein